MKTTKSIITITHVDGSDKLDVKVVFKPAAKAKGVPTPDQHAAMVCVKALGDSLKE